MDIQDEVMIVDSPSVKENKEIIKRREKKRKLQQINLFAKQIIDRMIKENVPPSPTNFLIYFEKYLEEKSPAQRESIKELYKVIR